MLCSGLIKYSTTWSVTSVAAAAANLNVMFLLWLKLSATYILLPQQPNLNVIERKFKCQILKPDPIILTHTPILYLLECNEEIWKILKHHYYLSPIKAVLLQFSIILNPSQAKYHPPKSLNFESFYFGSFRLSKNEEWKY